MNSLYGRLFRYRARPDRQPLEDFLSEALADLLTRMPFEDVIDFLDWCFAEARVAPDWRAALKPPLEWRTQVTTSGGIADLVLYAGKRPVMVVENKTWSGFRDHSVSGRQANQVTTYCRWLRGEAGEQAECAALLISATTDAPDGYHGDGDYAVAARGQVTWAALARWLAGRLPSPEQRQTWHDLAADLVGFIKEKNLSSEIYSQSDVAAISLALPTMERWEATFGTMWSAVEDARLRFLNKQVSGLQFQVNAGMIWQWRYGQAELTPRRSWVGLGLRFPEISQWYGDLALPTSPHFVLIAASDAGPLVLEQELPEGWFVDEEDGEYVFVQPLHELPASPDKRIDALHRWMQTGMLGAERILTTAKLK